MVGTASSSNSPDAFDALARPSSIAIQPRAYHHVHITACAITCTTLPNASAACRSGLSWGRSRWVCPAPAVNSS